MFHALTENAVFTQLLAPASRDESTGSGIYTSSYISAGVGPYITFLVDIGAISTGDTVDFAVLKATSSAGAGATTVTGAALTQVAAAGANNLYAVTIKADILGEDGSGNRYTHVAGRLTIGGSSAAVLTAVTGITYHLRTAPASDNGLEQDVIAVA